MKLWFARSVFRPFLSLILKGPFQAYRSEPPRVYSAYEELVDYVCFKVAKSDEEEIWWWTKEECEAYLDHFCPESSFSSSQKPADSLPCARATFTPKPGLFYFRGEPYHPCVFFDKDRMRKVRLPISHTLNPKLMWLSEQSVEKALVETDWSTDLEGAVLDPSMLERMLPECQGQTEEQYWERVERNIKDWNLSECEALVRSICLSPLSFTNSKGSRLGLSF